MDIKILGFRNKTVGFGGIRRNLNNDYIPLSEGDVINIKTRYSHEDFSLPFDGSNMKTVFTFNFEKFINKIINYNFTFLIELDPLDD